MNIGSVFYNLTIMPIQFLLEAVFCIYIDNVHFMGIAGAIIALSFVMNFLCLPIYNRADKIQESQRKMQKKLDNMTHRIKASFIGDERFMILQAFYKEQHYNPLMALRSSLSIIIEIPFFIAAYQFLSHCSALDNASFLVLKDFSSPDRLIHIKNLVGGGGQPKYTPCYNDTSQYCF